MKIPIFKIARLYYIWSHLYNSSFYLICQGSFTKFMCFGGEQSLKINSIEYVLARYFEKDFIIAMRDIPIIVSGKQGATGKTTVCNILKKHGYTAFEEWQLKNPETDEQKALANRLKNENEIFISLKLNKPISEVIK